MFTFFCVHAILGSMLHVCTVVCIYRLVFVCMYTCEHVLWLCVHVYLCMCMYVLGVCVHMHAYKSVCLHVCLMYMCVYLCVHIYACSCVCIAFICMFVHMLVCI